MILELFFVIFDDFGAHFCAVASLAVYRTHRLQDDSRISFFMILELFLMILHAFGAHFCAVTSLAVYRICVCPATIGIIISIPLAGRVLEEGHAGGSRSAG